MTIRGAVRWRRNGEFRVRSCADILAAEPHACDGRTAWGILKGISGQLYSKAKTGKSVDLKERVQWITEVTQDLEEYLAYSNCYLSYELAIIIL